ncbi:MAG: right-handed parallel beta-helix repeat-containing protein, partial [Promethearchaeota archaeon]
MKISLIENIIQLTVLLILIGIIIGILITTENKFPVHEETTVCSIHLYKIGVNRSEYYALNPDSLSKIEEKSTPSLEITGIFNSQLTKRQLDTPTYLKSKKGFNYQAHDPLRNKGDIEFNSIAQNENWEGTGSFGDPYIIERLNITNSTTNLMSIEDTTAYFVIRNNLLDGISTSLYSGIYLSNVTHCTITNNTIHNTVRGIDIDGASNNFILKNTCTGNVQYGIRIYKGIKGGKVSYNNLFHQNIL